MKAIKNSVPFKVQRKGKGRVIVFTDNTNFRAFWYGTNKLLMNAVFFGHQMLIAPHTTKDTIPIFSQDAIFWAFPNGRALRYIFFAFQDKKGCRCHP